MKLTFLLILLALVTVLVFQGIRVYRLIKISKMLVETAKPFSHTPSTFSKKVLILGDSLGVGVGSLKQEDTIAGRLHADYPNVYIKNLSVSGYKIIDALNVINTLPDNEEFDVVLLQIGGNDIVKGMSLSNSNKNLKVLLDKAKSHSRKVIFLTSGSVGFAPIFPQPFDWFYDRKSKIYLDSFEKIAKEVGVTRIDLYASREDDPFLKNIDLYYAKDVFHPSGDGYGLWYEKIKPELAILYL